MKRIAILFLPTLLFACQMQAQTTVTVGGTTLTERVVATGLQIPWEITWGPDDHIWASERQGFVRRINPENGSMTIVLNISNDIVGGDGEPGLLGMAFHPDFENTPKVYLVYTYEQGFFNYKEKLVTYDWDGSTLQNEQVVMDDIDAGNIHNGSRLLVLPDNTLLMTTGDVGNSSLSQNQNSINGKTLRMNLDGSIPADNPDPSSYIYTYGNRNAQGLCLAPDGKVYSSEHGQNHSDEVNLVIAGKNYGWPNVEGPCNTSSEINYCNNVEVIEPLWAWTSYCIAPNGLVYYDHPAIPEWQGSLLVAILGGISAQEPRLSQLVLNADGTQITAENEYFSNYGRIRDVCVNPYNGAVYFATNGSSYPGSGPNRIIEYRNLDFVSSNEPTLNSENQFIKVSPNPISEEGMMEFSENFVGHSYEIISYEGKVARNGIINNPQVRISKEDLPTGIYYVKATNKVGTITQTIVVR